MGAVIDQFIVRQLQDRQQRLKAAADQANHPAHLHQLLDEVDAALARVEDGTYGICEHCHEPVEADRLIADPLVRFCLDHLSRQERSALEQDLEMAAQVQRGLLPPQEMAAHGWRIAYHYEPAGLVSGDYCDVVNCPKSGLYFMVGDVSGKGVAASMLMAHLNAMFRTLISVGMPLKTMLEHASRVFCESTLPAQYATLICGRAQHDGKVEVCNAGHPPPLVIRDGNVAALDAADLPVGIFCNAEFSVVELNLEPGEGMLIYSDGVSEATDDLETEYGVDRLRCLAGCTPFTSPGELIAACRDDLAAFRGSRKADDMTLFALGRGC